MTDSPIKPRVVLVGNLRDVLAGVCSPAPVDMSASPIVVEIVTNPVTADPKGTDDA